MVVVTYRTWLFWSEARYDFALDGTSGVTLQAVSLRFFWKLMILFLMANSLGCRSNCKKRSGNLGALMAAFATYKAAFFS